MSAITHSQVQELVARLPVTKLPVAYDRLIDLVRGEPDAAPPQRDFMSLSLEERRRLLAQQAQEMVGYYEQTALERQEWQQGDFHENKCCNR
ncbi:MAG: hypothetical protein NTX50_14215 [Candidatus Sumerlaeota bacterium]|nr:hypothetical protein [Candidatus Sumerlaeota bacterium]